jgi:hypothetical protein
MLKKRAWRSNVRGFHERAPDPSQNQPLGTRGVGREVDQPSRSGLNSTSEASQNNVLQHTASADMCRVVNQLLKIIAVQISGVGQAGLKTEKEPSL